ncbi:MAG: putative periplasmic serine endoprotease DegP-like precursor [Candidatus Accumulibacter sp. BA-94]|nr:MAG: putative periplasmic serine endoprotease DegP-like precursor [Candidatus Accumulibacter sp. BA-94]
MAAVPAAATPVVALPDFCSIMDTVGPAVVNIGASGPQRTAISGNDPMFEFFRRFGVPSPQERGPARGMDSGFIVRSDGLILTADLQP